MMFSSLFCSLRHFGRCISRVGAPLAAAIVLAACAVVPRPNADAQPDAASQDATQQAASAPVHSQMDAALFYELLLSEMVLDLGDARFATDLMLRAARNVGEEPLYKRATEMAVRQRSGDAALTAVRAWRRAWPASLEAQQSELQVLIALGRIKNLAQPLRRTLARMPEDEKQALVAALPALLARAPERARLVREVESGFTDVLHGPPPLVATAWASIGRLRLHAGDKAGALQAARTGLAADATSEWLALLAVQLASEDVAGAGELVEHHLRSGAAKPEMHIAWARALLAAGRGDEARAALHTLTQTHPDYAEGWLLQGALLADEHRDAEAKASLHRYLGMMKGAEREADREGEDLPQAVSIDQARMMLARIAENQGDERSAERWLQAVRSSAYLLAVHTRRAALLAKRGEVAQARQLIRQAPEREEGDARLKLLAEVQLLQGIGDEQGAWELLRDALPSDSRDENQLYDAALAAERAGQLAEMERLLRRIIRFNPKSAQALNALGYSFADRNVRLKEARSLIERAVRLMPDDAFIQDSLGWVEFRQGRVQRARNILQAAWKKQPHAEIAAHLGEVLWVLGEREAARAIWAEGLRQDAKEKTLLRTMQRFGAQP